MSVTLDDVKKAQEVLSGVARKTDLIHSVALSGTNEVFLKTENLQRTGSFKLRGAYNKIHSLTDEEKAKGLIACSAGNHAQGVALASREAGCQAYICMPDMAPISKVEATKSYGAEAILVPGAYDEAAAEAARLQKEKGYTMILPFDDPYVIAGQGTIGLEILEQNPDVEAIVVPAGGGGLLAGIATAVKEIKPECKVFGVQARGANAIARSFKEGERLESQQVSTFADGIQVKKPGELTFEIIKEKVDGFATVTEDEIAAAILQLIEKQKIVAEGAGAVSVAAVMFDKIPVVGKNVVCVVSGGNIDVNILSRVINRGLMMNDRIVSLTIEMGDTHGSLARACKIISECGGNVLEVHHDRSAANISLNSAYVSFDLETRDAKQARELRETLEAEGFSLVRQ